MSTPGDRSVDDVEERAGDSGVGPRHAEGNKGWNEPVDDAPETLEGAVRADRQADEAPPSP